MIATAFFNEDGKFVSIQLSHPRRKSGTRIRLVRGHTVVIEADCTCQEATLLAHLILRAAELPRSRALRQRRRSFTPRVLAAR